MSNPTDAPKELWDKEAIYDEHFSPLITKLIALANEHKMPLAVFVQFAEDASGPGHSRTCIPVEGVTSDHMLRVYRAMQPEKPYAHMEIHETLPSGGKRITIKRV
jgi:hypothetical protein